MQSLNFPKSSLIIHRSIPTNPTLLRLFKYYCLCFSLTTCLFRKAYTFKLHTYFPSLWCYTSHSNHHLWIYDPNTIW